MPAVRRYVGFGSVAGIACQSIGRLSAVIGARFFEMLLQRATCSSQKDPSRKPGDDERDNHADADRDPEGSSPTS